MNTDDRLLIPIREASRLMGLSPKTGANWLSEGRYPIPTVRLGGLRLVRRADLIEYVDGLAATPAAAEALPQKRGRGRPRKCAAPAQGGE